MGGRSYFEAIERRRRRVVHVTPAGVFFRRLGNALDRMTGLLLSIAAAAAVVTLLAGIAAFSAAVLPDRRGTIRISVPDFTGTPYAAEAIDESIYEVRIEYKYDSSLPEGYVIGQYPAAGSGRIVKAGERRCGITLTLSRGTQMIVLPDCVGKSSAEAEFELKLLGFEVEKVSQYSHTVGAGRVISTSPAPLTDLPAGSRATLYVSLGGGLKLVVVPALSGLSESSALTRLLAAGLLAGQTEYIRSDAPAGSVVAQSLPFGSEVREGTRVSLTVSLGPG